MVVLGLAKEKNRGDSVTLLNPEAVGKIIESTSVDFFVETGAGHEANILDFEYTCVGAKIVSDETLYSKSNILLSRSAVSKSYFELMRPGNIVISMLHHDGVPQRKVDLEESGLVGIALDFLQTPSGKRSVYLDNITAQNGMSYGYSLLEKSPEEASVVILGYGNLAKHAIEYASRKKSDVIVLNKKHFQNLSNYISQADILVNGINWPLEKRGKEFLLKTEDLKLMKKGSVLVDLIVNPEGKSPIESCRPTYQENLHYTVGGVIHTCCWGWPGLTPQKTTDAYSRILSPILIDFLQNGFENQPANISRAYVNFDALNKKIFG